MEGRFLLSAIPSYPIHQLLTNPPGFQPIRPNTPVLPYGIVNRKATFIDTTVHIINGKHIVIGTQDYVAPFANLNATSGFIKIGSGGFIGNNAAIVSDPGRQAVNPTTSVIIGDNVFIGYNATVYGPSQIGGFGTTNGKATYIGPGALIDGATIGPGAIIGTLARVGPGVTVPSGVEVKPGVNITTNDQANNPALGFVEPLVAADQATMVKSLTNSKLLASGYATLYQGQSATGVTPGVATATAGAGPYNGNLANVEGANFEPLFQIAYPTTTGSLTTVQTTTLAPTVSASTSAPTTSPSFIDPSGKQLMAQLPNFPARVTGATNFLFRARKAAHHLGRSNSIAADQGQPINLDAITQTGRGVTITSPLGGSLSIGQGLQAQAGAVILGGDATKFTIGNNVSIGANSVVSQSSLGDGTVIGSHAYVFGSTLPAGTVVPSNAIIINGKPAGTVQW
jgi:carbonic anhydrase/acetyltransferase-like protein (isoleucine patch superfamily)